MASLPEVFLQKPIAHRALHDEAAGRAENHLAAMDAALSKGFRIEIDIQRSKDGQAMVFHDYHLSRLTEGTGAIAQKTAEELAKLKFRTGELGIPTLREVLKHIAGRVPLLIEIKDQDGIMGPNVGTLEREVARLVKSYVGPVAFMSFNPHAMAVMAEEAPQIARGLTTSGFSKQDWFNLKETVREHLRNVRDYERVGASFVSHQVTDLASQRVNELKELGARILTWTVRNADEAAEAAKVAENITFEGYLPS